MTISKRNREGPDHHNHIPSSTTSGSEHFSTVHNRKSTLDTLNGVTLCWPHGTSTKDVKLADDKVTNKQVETRTRKQNRRGKRYLVFQAQAQLPPDTHEQEWSSNRQLSNPRNNLCHQRRTQRAQTIRPSGAVRWFVCYLLI